MAKIEIVPSQDSKITRDPFSGSRKVYVSGVFHPEIQVAMREIALSDSKPIFAEGEFVKDNNEPVTVYDTSGPYTDPNVEIDIRKGIPKLRESWIMQRGDVEELDEISSEYGRQRLYAEDLD